MGIKNKIKLVRVLMTLIGFLFYGLLSHYNVPIHIIFIVSLLLVAFTLLESVKEQMKKDKVGIDMRTGMWIVVYYKNGIKKRSGFATEEGAIFFAKNQRTNKLAKNCLYNPDGKLVATDEMIKDMVI